MVLFTMLFFLNYIFISSEGCKYWISEGKEGTTDAQYLSQYHIDEEKRQQCYILSNFQGDDTLCCYKDSKCIKKVDTDTTLTANDCPKTDLKIINNCGMAGIYEPVYSTVCTEISLVQGYCCFVKTKEGNACIRTKKLHKDINETTDQINEFVRGIDENNEVESVICKGWNLKIYKILTMLITLILI